MREKKLDLQKLYSSSIFWCTSTTSLNKIKIVEGRKREEIMHDERENP